jgi:hypothetical protein
MSLITAYLWLEPTKAKVEPELIRHTQSLKCGHCRETYIFDYPSRCTDPRDLAWVLEIAQGATTKEHFSGHRSVKVIIANTTPYFAKPA